MRFFRKKISEDERAYQDYFAGYHLEPINFSSLFAVNFSTYKHQITNLNPTAEETAIEKRLHKKINKSAATTNIKGGAIEAKVIGNGAGIVSPFEKNRAEAAVNQAEENLRQFKTHKAILANNINSFLGNGGISNKIFEELKEIGKEIAEYLNDKHIFINKGDLGTFCERIVENMLLYMGEQSPATYQGPIEVLLRDAVCFEGRNFGIKNPKSSKIDIVDSKGHLFFCVPKSDRKHTQAIGDFLNTKHIMTREVAANKYSLRPAI